MKTRTDPIPAALALATCLALAGCGNKGPLVLAPAPVDQLPTAEGAVPVEVESPLVEPDPVPEAALPDPTAVDPMLDPVPEPERLDADAPPPSDADAGQGDPADDDGNG